MSARFEHAGCGVSDIERASVWYTKWFGFKEVKRFDKPELKLKGAVLQTDGGVLELLQAHSVVQNNIKQEDVALSDVIAKPGNGHIALSVESAQNTYDALVLEKENVLTDMIDGRFFFVRDPDGNVIEVR
jgi:catechol 2,3-dioxygenase-like lactoylglutathione lyase family enzyme